MYSILYVFIAFIFAAFLLQFLIKKKYYGGGSCEDELEYLRNRINELTQSP